MRKNDKEVIRDVKDIGKEPFLSLGGPDCGPDIPSMPPLGGGGLRPPLERPPRFYKREVTTIYIGGRKEGFSANKDFDLDLGGKGQIKFVKSENHNEPSKLYLKDVKLDEVTQGGETQAAILISTEYYCRTAFYLRAFSSK